MDDVVSSMYSVLNEEKGRFNVPMHAVHVTTEDVVCLNDKAVASILQLDTQGALQSLQMALASIAALQAKPPTQQPTFFNYNDESPIASIPLHNSQQIKNTESFDGMFLFFNRALVIPHHCDFDLHCPKQQSRALATVLYNIALVYHLEAMRQGQHQTTLLKHALEYYGHAYRTIESSAQKYGFQDVLLPLLALFNNMGHVHSILLDDTNLARQCLRWMQGTFANSRVKRQLFPEDYQFFFQYISMVASRQLLMASAA